MVCPSLLTTISLKPSIYSALDNGFFNVSYASFIASQELLMQSLEERSNLESCSTADDVRMLAVKAMDDHMACIEELKGAFEQGHYDDAAQLVMKLKYIEKFQEEIRLKSKELL